MKTSFEELNAFVAVVEAGSITAAADRLDQTASGISRALGRLETKLDTTLLRRTTRRIELTDEGKAFLEHARAILIAIDVAEEQMSARKGSPTGRLRVNAAVPFMLHAIVPLIPDFMRAFPEVLLELDTDDLNIDLIERHTDIAIRIGALQDSGLNARPLGSSRMRVLASPAYLTAHGEPTHVDALAQHTLLGFTQPDTLNRWPLSHAQGDEWHITPSVCASSGETLRRLALDGAGIVCLSDFMTAQDRTAGNLVQILSKPTRDVRQPISAVYYRNAALSARVLCFLDFVAARLAKTEWRI